MDEIELLADADVRARDYVAAPATGRSFQPEGPLRAWRVSKRSAARLRPAAGQTLALLDEAGSPATVASNGPRYFGFVIGASQPVAAAASAWRHRLGPVRLFLRQLAGGVNQKTAARCSRRSICRPAAHSASAPRHRPAACAPERRAAPC